MSAPVSTDCRQGWPRANILICSRMASSKYFNLLLEARFTLSVLLKGRNGSGNKICLFVRKRTWLLVLLRLDENIFNSQTFGCRKKGQVSFFGDTTQLYFSHQAVVALVSPFMNQI